MIGSINLRQARFLSDAYEASSLDSIEDYPNDSGSSLGFPPGSYPDSSIIALHKLLKRLTGIDVPEKDRLDAYLRHVTRRNRRPKTLHSLYTSIVFFLGMIKDSGKTRLEDDHKRGCRGVYRAGAGPGDQDYDDQNEAGGYPVLFAVLDGRGDRFTRSIFSEDPVANAGAVAQGYGARRCAETAIGY